MSVDIKEAAKNLTFQVLRARFMAQGIQLPELIRLQNVTHQLRTLLVQLQQTSDPSSTYGLLQKFLDGLLIFTRKLRLGRRGRALLFARASLLLGNFGRFR